MQSTQNTPLYLDLLHSFRQKLILRLCIQPHYLGLLMSKKIKIIAKKVVPSQDRAIDLLAMQTTSSLEGFTQNLTNDELGKLLNDLSIQYYNGQGLVPDQTFDALQDILAKRDSSHPQLYQIRSEIQSDEEEIPASALLGGKPTLTNPKYRIKAKLPYWMGSMDKVKPDSSLNNWTAKFPGPKVLSDKLDGVSALMYVEIIGVDPKISLFTGGNGSYGQDISCLLPYLNCPGLGSLTAQKVYEICGNNNSSSDNTKAIAIRAELVMTKSNFQQFSKSVPNARNLVSGVVNSKTIDTDLVKLIDFVAYELINGVDMCQGEQFKLLESLGFQVATHLDGVVPDTEFLVSYYRDRKVASQYEIDGIIVCDMGAHVRYVTDNPKYAVAFKMIVNETDQVAQTVVIGVDWNIEKDGYLFPVIRVQPVFVSGSTIQNASGKSAKFILDNCIGPGSIVKIARDGDTIPGIYDVIEPATSGEAELPPTTLGYHWTDTEVNLVLNDIESNPIVQLKRIIHFFRSMNVVGFAEGLISRCFSCGLNTVNKILNASIEDFMQLPGIQIKMGTKIYTAIKEALNKPELYQIMVASNAFGRGFGERKIKAILAQEPDIVMNDTTSHEEVVSKICQIDGFNIKTAEQFASGLAKFKQYLKDLPSDLAKKIVYPVSVDKVSIEAISGKFVGQTIVFSGFRNKLWENAIEKEGGKIGSSVSRATTLVVVKDMSFLSGKIAKAQGLGTAIMDIEQFRAQID